MEGRTKNYTISPKTIQLPDENREESSGDAGIICDDFPDEALKEQATGAQLEIKGVVSIPEAFAH